MLTIFQSIVPIFLAIFLGNGLKHLSSYPDSFWSGLEKLCFYILYPALLFVTIYKADFAALTFGPVVLTLSISLIVIVLITLATWPVLKRFKMPRATYSSVFQSSIRWNGFVAFVIAENLFPPEAVALVGLVMAAIIIPLNAISVAGVAWFTQSEPNFAAVAKRIAVNPLIIGAALGILARLIPGGIPNVFMDGLNLIARAALGMGLLTIGAGLRLADIAKPSLAVMVPTIIKLVLYPAIVILCALAVGINDQQLVYLALCASMPTAMNGYVLARQMGGDAENYAITATVQTLLAFFTIPLVIHIATQLIGG